MTKQIIQDLTLSQATIAFIEALKAKQMSNETVRGYSVDLKQLQGFLGKEANGPVFVDDISTEQLEAFQKTFQDRQCKTATVNRKINSVSSFFNYAVKKKWVPINPANDIERVKVQQAERIFLTKEEMHRIVENIDHPTVKYVVILMSNTGLRISECVHLTLTNVDLKKKVVHVIEGKGGKNRDVPMNDELVLAMKRYLADVRPNTSSVNFFALKKTGAVSQQYVNRVLKETCKNIGMKKDVTSHILRHSFASQLVKTDTHVAVIQRLLGHANIRTTSVYLHADQSDLEEAVNTIKFL
ncbi:tyrosine-type recombinase/integrase [Sporosarcina sp. FSL K6-5500]|uniref:tyrosine-type recombinase/integrase n=1 Tax=Sporosarcina sp. FSL K6-5500 TaxID=2921558 RepID=UPI0030F6DE21